VNVFRLRLGQDEAGRDFGIRDLATVSDGFLVLAGPSLPEGEGALGSGTAFYWRDDGTLTRLQDVGLRKDGVKPETLLLLDETATSYRVLVMHDGIAGGFPLEFQLRR